jgi:hypothetical protein
LLQQMLAADGDNIQRILMQLYHQSQASRQKCGAGFGQGIDQTYRESGRISR